jgi:RNA polymerase sigma-70 factor (sigma-E family)
MLAGLLATVYADTAAGGRQAVLSPRAATAPAQAGWTAGQALTELYEAHYRPLVRMAVLLLGDTATAEEVVQDSFIAMNTAWARLRHTDKALAYLRQSVVNGARSVLRHRQVADRTRPPADPDAPSAEHGALVSLERSAVVSALRLLSPRQREVLVLRYYLDLPESQVAATMGITAGAVKAHTFRALAAMRRALRPPAG